jgi:hypothetical protein
MKRLEILLIITLIVLGCNSNKVSDDSKSSLINSEDNIASDTTLVINDNAKADSIRSFFDINDSIKVLDFRYDPQWPYYVFVDYNKNSRLYEKLENGFNLSDYSHKDIEWILGNTELRTSDSTSSILRTNYADFLTTWIDLYAINDVLYVTNSCEPEGFYLLTDSLFYDGYNMDAPDISIIKSVSQIDNGFKIDLVSTEKEAMRLEFYLVDSVGTYLVAYTGKTQKEFFSYMTKLDSVRNYTLVHHECDALTEKEHFDDIDYNKVIKKYSN